MERQTIGTPEEIQRQRAVADEIAARLGRNTTEYRRANIRWVRLNRTISGKRGRPSRQPAWENQVSKGRPPSVVAERLAGIRALAKGRQEAREECKRTRLQAAEARFEEFLGKGEAYSFLVQCSRYMGKRGIAALMKLADSGDAKIQMQALALMVRALEVTAKAEMALAESRRKESGGAGVRIIDPGWPSEGSKS